MMRFASLGSGSDGNALLVEAGRTRILVDCGFALEDTRNRLGRLGIDAGSITAIVVTHEHEDHVGGVARFARKFNVPVWLTHGTLRGAGESFDELCGVHTFDCHGRLQIGDIEVEPYTVPHDAREPAQFVFGDGAWRLGVLTDAGAVTAHIQEVLNGVDALVLECNHDTDMLWAGPYPAVLKQRIAGKFGHLDNGSAGRLLTAIDASRLQHLIAAHISRHNNTAELAADALARALGCGDHWIGVATQKEGFGWRVLS
jgi:phosphoribosyl 1,2-cyclic phosphodiesterase